MENTENTNEDGTSKKPGDTPIDWLFSSLVFANAIGYLLDENQGILIHLKGEMKQLKPDTDKVIIYRSNDQILIMKCDDDLVDGQPIVMQ